ncbi:MAG: hypothetical protein ACI8ZO_000094 [Flavobacteriales bacterium]|jgi:hypothetical protein
MRLLFCSLAIVFSLALVAQDNCKSYKSSWPLQKQQVPNINFNARSDTFDIQSYEVTLDITDTQNKQLKGFCSISLEPKLNSNNLTLDLQALAVDSIVWNGQQLSYSHTAAIIRIDVTGLWTIGNPENITVYYGGTPDEDPSGFGGFYFESGYAYNLGVAFSDNPHSYGRVWHPCFDNFVERASYTFHIKTANGYLSHCNGALTNETSLAGDTLVRTWELEEEIPTYLASIAASNYATVHQTINGENGPMPVELVAKPADTTKLKNSFANLEKTFQAFEAAFGAYSWNKVGYNLTTVGAMEHPTSIAYPISIVNGNLTYENIMAHELAHHWWGNLVTCETAEDMWLNEGFAEFCSHLFLESVYDKQTYLDAVEANHFDVLKNAHKEEGAYLPISGIPHENTYGKHVYNKGASVVHTLRSQMGDAAFFSTMKGFLEANKFQHVSSDDLRVYINNNSTYNSDAFFNGYVFSGGFAHFSIDSVNIISSGPSFEHQVFVRQKGSYAPQPHHETKIVLTFLKQSGEIFMDTVKVDSYSWNTSITIPFEADWVIVNRNNEICQAVLENEHVIKSLGSTSFSDAGMSLNVSDIGGDSALVRIEQHLTYPDPIKNNTKGYRLSTSRYWTVEGFIGEEFDASTTVFYDSRGDFPLDGDLAAVTEDSILLMYRYDAQDDWTEYWNYTKNVMGSSTNGIGRMSMTKVLPGQYTFANGVSTIGINEATVQSIKVFPNPTTNFIQIENVLPQTNIQLYDIQGKEVINKLATSSSIKINMQHLPSGSYILRIGSHQEKIEIIH